MDIVEQWPQDRRAPERSRLYRWLRAATIDGRIQCAGGGTKNDPFRYGLAERAPMLRPDEGASKKEMQAWNERHTREFFDRLNRRQARHGPPPALPTP